MARPSKIDVNSLVGQKFNQLTIINYLGRVNGVRMVKALCDCGVEKDYRLGNIIFGNTKSCGCYNIKVSTERTKTFITHGLSKHQLWRVWSAMKKRCYNTTCEDYPDYGAKGVRICQEWLDNPKLFVKWAENNGWKPGLQIDKDKLSDTKPGKLYSPEFCCFLTQKESSAYKSNSIMLEYKGETRSLAEWCTIINLKHSLMQNRYKWWWGAKKMFETPNKHDVPILYNGETKCLRDWCTHFGLKYGTVHSRIKNLGWTYEQAFTTPLVPPNMSGVHKKRIA